MGEIVCKEPEMWLLSQLLLSAKCFCRLDFLLSPTFATQVPSAVLYDLLHH